MKKTAYLFWNALIRLPVIGRAVLWVHRIDWRRRDVRDCVVIFGVALAVYAWAHFDEVPPKLFQFGLDYADWEADDAIFVTFVMSVALLIFVLRRVKDLKHEIKARREAEAKAQRLARHDPLTGLPNRRFYNEKLADMLRTIIDGGQRAAVLMLDLDGFKAINDLHGHLAGDKTLVECAERIAGAAKGAVVARVGGDEFAVIVPKITSPDDAAHLARRIIGSVSEPFIIASTEAALGVGIGISIVPDNGTTAEELVRRADLALYRAKAEGRSCTRFFEPAMDAHLERRSTIERELRAAVMANSIAVHYQPLIELARNQIIGFEALARWYSPALGFIEPEVFIPIAEEIGVMQRLGDQLLRTACREAMNWPDDFTLAFNISPVQLRDPTFGLRVLAILGETGFPPRRLELEVTESAIVGDAKLAQQLIDELRRAGVRISLDDFGTGYATMSQLLSFRFDKIKIDRSFVHSLGTDEGSEVIIRAIIGLAKGLGLTTTAEGIESATQLADLKADGCAEGQGYLFGKAIPAAEIPALLGQRSVAVA